jgi:RNA polymerase primary sigma factor
VASFRIDSLAGLCRQMSFTPVDVRLAQLAAAEALLLSIDPLRAYPADFIIFRVTGYRPKDVSADMLPGLAVQHDLGLLVERVSDTFDFSTTAVHEPVLSIDDVTERFNVAGKTVQRWRRRGLPARRFVFPDGKRRVGFLLGHVERFIAAHRQQLPATANVSAMVDTEVTAIVRHARRLAVECRCDEDEITRRVGRRFNRSPLAILHTLRKWDTEHPDKAVLSLASSRLGDLQRGRILRARRRGLPLSRIARKVRRPRSAVYRVIIDERIDRLVRRKVRFVDDPLFHQPDAADVIEQIVKQFDSALATTTTAPTEVVAGRVPRDVPPFLASLYRTPLLSPAHERALFLKFNYHKYRFAAARRRLDPQVARWRELATLESHLKAANETKNQIVAANLRLVVSVARKHLVGGLTLMELVSDGNLTLMRAVDGFDISRGHRFSTYATFALMKGFARSVPLMVATNRVGSTGGSDATLRLQAMPDPRLTPAADRLAMTDEVSQLLSRLTGKERTVILARYGLSEGRHTPATFDEVAATLGLTPQRVRQIEHAAIAKLRASHP